MIYKLSKENLNNLLGVWDKKQQLLVPYGQKDNVMLLPWNGEEPQLDYINLALPVKEFLFEQKEALFSWEKKDGTFEVKNEAGTGVEKKILFGIRACDTYGVFYTDRFYLGEFEDTNYRARRDAMTVVALNCLKSGKNCFCSSQGVGPFSKVGHDLVLTEMEDYYLLESATDKGDRLIAWGHDYLKRDDAQGVSAEKIDELEQKVKEGFHVQLDLSNIGVELSKTFDADFWEQEAHACISCTGCTAVCPTCTCFNVVEEVEEDSGRRVRYWDSCQSKHFTRNAGDHNPRSNVSRVRYRIYDKLKYIEERFGYKGCTGCGRCIDTCPTNISILKIIERVQEEANKPGAKLDVAQITEIAYQRPEDDIAMNKSLYMPDVATITKIKDETPDIKRFYLEYDDKELHKNFKFKGQFFEITVFGVGEVAISIPFGPSQRDHFDFCIKKVGSVTEKLHAMQPGDKVGLRGPFGKAFPYEEVKGRDILIVGSGVGLAPVRTMIVQMMENREDFGKIVIMASALHDYGLVLTDDLEEWSKVPGVVVKYSLKYPSEEIDAYTGYINDLLPDLGLEWHNTTAVICASPRRIKKVSKDLLALGMKGTDILTTLETHMRCGSGKCGHCKVGAHYMCVDGPVYNYEEMLNMPPEF